ncbi:beta-hexosaminidase [Ahniella affigens]|uniref:beta-N-acetylhexosaminidase n=1 Tax=Ahniella affigens TaxID=2021234 RepID=A0A2P1PUY3_9GAMM|nr:beta-N-acetylhexosaminidase [Ahniella affigens]AVP98657.1 beta-hexosaminidase [Ahniella affigens]
MSGLQKSFLFGTLAMVVWFVQAASLPIVPQPNQRTEQAGAFDLRDAAFRAQDPAAAAIAETLAQRAMALCDRTIPLNPDAPAQKRIDLAVLAIGDSDESYRITIEPERVLLSARHAAGLHQAANTFLQLLCSADGGSLPAEQIVDAPRFRWRGALLDSARHMQSVDFIKRFIDAMAWHRLNVLHWHLTDDQGWRLEIKQYPRLTEVGAFRVPAGAAGTDDSGQPRSYGGFYTQAEARELAAYAAARGILIVPEIDVPAHASAIIAAYPELGAIPGSVKAVPADWGIYQNLLSLEPTTQTFVENVLREVMAVFPSHYLHVGGDELDATQWRQSPAGQTLIARLGRDDRATLQAAYTEPLAQFVANSGRRLIGWDEMLSPALDPGAVIMSWRGIDGGLQAAAKGHDTVLSPWPDLYLDNSQSDASDEPPGRVRQVTLASVYAFNPMPKGIAADKRQHVLGIQANLWSEHIRTEDRMAHMAFPRLAALAEVAWTQSAQKDWQGFLKRLPASFAIYDRLHLAYADSAFAPRVETDAAGETMVVNQVQFGTIRVSSSATVTARDPTWQALAKRPGTIYAQTYLGDQPISRVRQLEPGAERWLRTSASLKLCGDAIPIHLEDDAPFAGARARFAVDIQHPCWIWPKAPLTKAAAVQIDIGQVPFNFQIGAAKDQIRFESPQSTFPELVMRRGSCQGPELHRWSLQAALSNPGVTALLLTELPTLAEDDDVCLQFAQAQLEPVWVIDRIRWSPR